NHFSSGPAGWRNHDCLDGFPRAQAQHWYGSGAATLWDSTEASAPLLPAWPLSAAHALFRTEPGELWRPHRQQRMGLPLGLLLSSAPRQSGGHSSGFGGVYGGARFG